jgi:two-component system chemotaxis response regulator CheB
MILSAPSPPPGSSRKRGPKEPIRVLIVDDSVVIRSLVAKALEQDPAFQVVGIAPNGVIALAKIPLLSPDVLTLDIEMPEMGGLETLHRVKSGFPHIRVVLFSPLSQRGAEQTFDALGLGADDYVTRAAPVGSHETSLQRMRHELAPKIKQFFPERVDAPAPKPDLGALPTTPTPRKRSVDIIAIAVSTGGPNALAEILPEFPAGLRCPIVITQHNPTMFTRLLAERLSSRSQLLIEEARDGMAIEAGKAFVAPGDYHLALRSEGGRVVAKLNQDPPENSCRPAADVMFRSVSQIYGPRALAVILTGMGKDGLRGIEQMKQAGSPVIAQDRASSVVWSMPGYVVASGLADAVVPIDRVVSEVMKFV